MQQEKKIYLVFFFPQVKRIFTGKTVVCLIVGMVIYQIVSGLPRSFAITLKMITSPVTNRTITFLIDMDHSVFLQSFFLSYSIPTFLCFSFVVVGTIFLVRKFKKSRQLRASMTRTEKESDKISDKDLRLICSVIFICVVYIIGVTPNILISIASGIHPRMKINDPYFGYFANALVAIGNFFQAISCSVNIFLYFKMGSRFKQIVQQIFFCHSN